MVNLVYSLNVTIPVFFILLLGYLLKVRNIVNAEYVIGSNQLTFRVLLPVMLFNNMRDSNFMEEIDLKFFIVCFLILLLYPLAVWAIARIFIKDPRVTGSFVQGTFRGNTAIIGVSLAQNIYGTEMGPIPVMLGVAMFMYNTMSVIILTCNGDGSKNVKDQFFSVVGGIIKNPIIWGIILGLICSIWKVEFPLIVGRSLDNLGGAASVVSLLAAGGGFSFETFRRQAGVIGLATFVKLFVMPFCCLMAGYFCGYRGISLFSFLVMGGVSTATTSAVMAREMGCDEELAINILAMTTLCAAVSLTFWVFVLQSLELL